MSLIMFYYRNVVKIFTVKDVFTTVMFLRYLLSMTKRNNLLPWDEVRVVAKYYNMLYHP